MWTYATRGGHAGGIVVVDRIAFFGAIGVAGAYHPDQDILCAQATLAVLNSQSCRERPFEDGGSAEREVVDAVCEIGRLTDVRDQLQIGDALSERHVQLVRVDHSGKLETHALSANRFGEEVGSAREECPSPRRGAVAKLGIIQPA